MGSRTLESYNLAAATYDAEPNSILFMENEVVLSMLDVQNGDFVLDAACGTGKYVLEVVKNGVDCIGMDFSGDMLAMASGKCPGRRFVKHNLMSLPLPFADGAFTKIVFAHGLRHMAAIEGLFLDFARILRPGGRLVVSMTHPGALFSRFEYRVEDCIGGAEIDISGEKHSYSFNDIEKAAQASGLCLAGFEHIRVDERLRSILTPDSYEQVKGTPLILAMQFSRPPSAGCGGFDGLKS